MASRAVTLVLSVMFSSFAVAASAGEFEGNWKLNLAKSKIRSEYMSYTMVIELVGPNSYHIVYEMVTKTGEKRRPEITLIYDGKDRPVQNGPAGTTQINERPDPSTWKSTNHRNGKVVSELIAVVAADNKTHTATRQSLGGDGRFVEEVFFFDRQ